MDPFNKVEEDVVEEDHEDADADLLDAEDVDTDKVMAVVSEDVDNTVAITINMDVNVEIHNIIAGPMAHVPIPVRFVKNLHQDTSGMLLLKLKWGEIAICVLRLDNIDG